MLSVEENERLTRVGPGTPMGELLRRYWHPVAAAEELLKSPTKAVKLLCEDLVLYQDRSGNYGLIDRYCAHRRVDLTYGIPEEHGLRCMYHGWQYDETGQCVEQPFEETVRPDAKFKGKIKMNGYPVQELGGLIFAYLGPQPVPELPHWDLFVAENAFRHIGAVEIPGNWLQIMENSLDPVHLEWMHGNGVEYSLLKQGPEGGPGQEWFDHALATSRVYKTPHEKIGFDVFEHGIIKRRVVEGQTEEDDAWRVGHPMIFPNILGGYGGLSLGFQYRVPMDDTHTWHVWYTTYFMPGADVPKQDVVPYYEVPLTDENGRYMTELIDGGDLMAWTTQGPIAKRELERLAESDKGIILYRKLLEQQMELVEDGGDPMNVFRDPVKSQYVEFPRESSYNATSARRAVKAFRYNGTRFSQVVDQIEDLYAQSADAAEQAG
jgi:5,5'-dehydrodivanillate O-demethylase